MASSTPDAFEITSARSAALTTTRRSSFHFDPGRGASGTGSVIGLELRRLNRNVGPEAVRLLVGATRPFPVTMDG